MSITRSSLLHWLAIQAYLILLMGIKKADVQIDLFGPFLLYKGGEVRTSTVYKFLFATRHDLLEKGRCWLHTMC